MVPLEQSSDSVVEHDWVAGEMEPEDSEVAGGAGEIVDVRPGWPSDYIRSFARDGGKADYSADDSGDGVGVSAPADGEFDSFEGIAFGLGDDIDRGVHSVNDESRRALSCIAPGFRPIAREASVTTSGEV